MNPVAQGLPVHPGQPRRARPVHPLQRIGDCDQTSRNPAIALLSRPPAQLFRTDVIPDPQSTHCGPPIPHHNICYSRPISDATFLASQPQLRWVLFTLGMIAFLLVALGCIVAIPVALNYLPLFIGRIIDIARWPALLVCVAVALAFIYRYGPSRTEPRWRWISWGSTFAALAWLAASALFSWYAASFGSFNKTYGSLGAVIGFMTWMWISIIVILVGAKLNAEAEHQTARESTVGQPKPLGRRGARMADTVGPAR
jgi:Virulence factor BrkB